MPYPITRFSQASLQDYLDCRRRFYLRYRLRLVWPALEAEPVEAFERETALGAAFHRLVQQHLVGVPAELLTARIADADLAAWWQAYLDFVRPDLSGIRPGADARLYPEFGLSAPLAGVRLVAQYDLVVVAPTGQATIYDWKTSRRLPQRQRLAARMQTRVYRSLLAMAGGSLNGGAPFPPEAITMIYWFPGFPAAEARFAYDSAQASRDRQALESLMAEAQALEEKEAFLTDDERRCRFCTYRSLCNRGVQAGTMDDEDESLETEDSSTDEDEVDLDFDQITEISL